MLEVRRYILDGERCPIREPNLLRWCNWFETADRTIIQTELLVDGRQIFVSTVFLGLNHNFGPTGPPVLYETMVFSADGTPLNEWTDRYATEAEARKGHEAILGALQKAAYDPRAFLDPPNPLSVERRLDFS